MPVLLWMFTIGVSITSVNVLWAGRGRIDAAAHSHNPRSACAIDVHHPSCYDVWASPGWTAIASEDHRCHVVYFATVAGGSRTRLQIGGIEQLVDNGWSFVAVIPEDHVQTVPFVFLDAVSQMELARRIAVVTCLHDPGRPDYGALYDSTGVMR